MKKVESEMMICFLHRTSMYIGHSDKDNIVSFMHGVDFGRRVEASWTSLLKDFISSKHHINGGALGWPNQIEIYSKNKHLNWVAAFKDLMFQLIKESKQIPYTKRLEKLDQKMGN